MPGDRVALGREEHEEREGDRNPRLGAEVVGEQACFAVDVDVRENRNVFLIDPVHQSRIPIQGFQCFEAAVVAGGSDQNQDHPLGLLGVFEDLRRPWLPVDFRICGV